MVCHQGGLSSGWSIIRVVSHHGGLSSGWSLIWVVSHLGSFHQVVAHQCGLQDGLSSGWSVVWVVFHEDGLSSGWIFIRWSVIRVRFSSDGLSSGFFPSDCHHGGFSSDGIVVKVAFHQSVIMLFIFFIRLSLIPVVLLYVYVMMCFVAGNHSTRDDQQHVEGFEVTLTPFD